jgi:predicted DNA-binding WGR domain protein
MRRFELIEGKSSKFWQVALDGTSSTVSWGRIGTDGQTQHKTWPTAVKAQAEVDKLIAAKTGKGYTEVTNGAAAADDDGAATSKETRPKDIKAKATPEAPAAGASDGWLDGGGGYAIGIRDGAVVARNAKGKVLASVPKAVKDGEAYETLCDAVELLANHAAECRETVESWMLRSLPVPRTVLDAIWADPDWRGPLESLVVDADGALGILRAVESRGLGIVTLDGETEWVAPEVVSIPHPILLAELDDWRAMLTELGITQATAQLFRETFPRPATPNGSSISEFEGGTFEMLAHANHAARKLGYRVSGGCAVCRVWEGGDSPTPGLIEARYDLGGEDPMYEATTGELSWVDGRQRGLTLADVGPVAFSEGMRMASALYAKRKIEQQGGDDV